MNARLDGGAQPQGSARSTSAIRERWWLVLLAAVVVGALTFGVSILLTPRYSATAQIAYSQNDAQLTSLALSSAGTPAAAHNVANDALVLKTKAFAKRVSEALNGSVGVEELTDSVTVTSNRDSDLIEVTAAGSDRSLVVDIANTYAGQFAEQRQADALAALTKAQELLQTRIDQMTEADAASPYGISLKQRNDDLLVLLSLRPKDYKVLQEASRPTSAQFPFYNLLIGLAAGLILGLVGLLILNRFDRRIKDEMTLERAMDLPIIGTVPHVSGPRSKSRAGTPPVGFANGNEKQLEPMRMLCSNLKALGFGDTKRSVLITSVAQGEYKTSLAVNLALTMALAGDRVVLVDADLRTPMIHQYLGIPNSDGLGDLLVEPDVPWSNRIKAVDLSQFVSPEIAASRQTGGKEAPVNKFLCLTSGNVSGDPAELVELPAMADVLSDLQGISDYVIVDSPPMLVASDCLALSRSVDALVFASVLGRDTDEQVLEARQLLSRAEVAPLGIVVCSARR